MCQSSEPIAIINYLDLSEVDLSRDVQEAIARLSPKHNLYIRNPASPEEFLRDLDAWPRNNAQFLYLAAHGNSLGLSRNVNGDDLVTWPQIVQRTAPIDIILLAACNTDDVAGYLYANGIARLGSLGAKGRVNPDQLEVVVTMFLDSLYDPISGFDFRPFTELAQNLDKQIPDKFVYSPKE